MFTQNKTREPRRFSAFCKNKLFRFTLSYRGKTPLMSVTRRIFTSVPPCPAHTACPRRPLSPNTRSPMYARSSAEHSPLKHRGWATLRTGEGVTEICENELKVNGSGVHQMLNVFFWFPLIFFFLGVSMSGQC